MEQKKILWIIISAALFLSAVFIAGLLWFYPSNGTQTAAKGENGAGKATVDFDPVEWVRNSNDYPGLDTSKADQKNKNDEFTIVYGESDGGAATASASSPELAAEVPETPAPAPVVREIKKTEPAKVAVKPVPEKTVGKSAAEPRSVTEYWIQAGSYKSMSGAQSAREKLSGEGVASRITIKTVDGADYYRVRIGPYSNKQEAEKFLEWVKKMDPFKSSYISKVTAKR